MLSLREIHGKTKQQQRDIRKRLDQSNKTVGWCPDDADLYTGLSAADHLNVKSSLQEFSLAEVLVYGSTAQGADGLVAAKVHDTLVAAAKNYDICETVGYVVNQWPGGNLTVDIAVDGTYRPKPFSSVGTMPDVNASYVQATLTPVAYGAPILASNRMVEDNEFGIIQWHVEQAGAACGDLASELAVAVLKAGADGDGTLNTQAAGADTTTYAQALAAVTLCGNDNFIADTMILTPEVWRDAIGVTAAGLPGVAAKVPIPEGFDLSLQQLNLLFRTYPSLHDAADLAGAAMTACVTLVFSRKNALLTGRKRWLEIKDYADPINDIAGAVVSFRQDSVTLYKDAICVLTET